MRNTPRATASRSLAAGGSRCDETSGPRVRVRVVPAGDAWQSALKKDPSLVLWQEDGIHPTEAGTYLAACVFYAVIFKESPEGLSYRGNLSKEMARELQAVAAKKVMNSP